MKYLELNNKARFTVGFNNYFLRSLRLLEPDLFLDPELPLRSLDESLLPPRRRSLPPPILSADLDVFVNSKLTFLSPTLKPSKDSKTPSTLDLDTLKNEKAPFPSTPPNRH